MCKTLPQWRLWWECSCWAVHVHPGSNQHLHILTQASTCEYCISSSPSQGELQHQHLQTCENVVRRVLSCYWWGRGDAQFAHFARYCGCKLCKKTPCALWGGLGVIKLSRLGSKIAYSKCWQVITRWWCDNNKIARFLRHTGGARGRVFAI